MNPSDQKVTPQIIRPEVELFCQLCAQILVEAWRHPTRLEATAESPVDPKPSRKAKNRVQKNAGAPKPTPK